MAQSPPLLAHQPDASSPPIGRLSVRKLLLALRLDEERVVELLGLSSLSSSSNNQQQQQQEGGVSGEGETSPPLLNSDLLAGRLLGCFGDLFSASMDIGWRSEPEADGSCPPRCMLTIANNDVSRVRAQVESLLFQSCVSPRLAVCSAYSISANLLLRWYLEDSWEMRWHHRLWSLIQEVLCKESLDVTVCLSAHMELVKPQTPKNMKAQQQQQGGKKTGTAPSSSSSTAELAAAPKLRIVLSGGSTRQGLLHVHPIYLLNDISMSTLFDSFKLFEEGSM